MLLLNFKCYSGIIDAFCSSIDMLGDFATVSAQITK